MERRNKDFTFVKEKKTKYKVGLPDLLVDWLEKRRSRNSQRVSNKKKE